MGLVCGLLADEGSGNLQIYCLSFWDVNLVYHRSNHLHTWDPAEHLSFVNPYKFRTLAKFKHSWLASAIDT